MAGRGDITPPLTTSPPPHRWCSRDGLLPHANAGALYFPRTRTTPSGECFAGMMLEVFGRGSATDWRRIKSRAVAWTRCAGRASSNSLHDRFAGGHRRIREDRLVTLRAIVDAHEEFATSKKSSFRNFLPKPRTAMASSPPASDEEFHWTIAVRSTHVAPTTFIFKRHQPQRRSRTTARLWY